MAPPRKYPARLPLPKPKGRVPTTKVLEPLQDFTATEVAKNMRLKYRGDSVEFVTKFLNKAQEGSGKYMLPVFDLKDGDDRKWINIPGDPNAEYTVVDIETARAHAKTGKALPELVIIKCSSFTPTIRIGLRRDDVAVKFGALFIPTVYEPEEVPTAVKISLKTSRESWQNEAQSDGW